MEFKDYYKTLGVAKTSTAEEIKKAYRKLARKYHPDVSKAPDATAQMAALNEANDVLSDPEKRVAYDSLGDAPQARAGGGYRPPPNWDAGFEFSDAAGDASGDSGGDYSDFFEQLFGRAARSQRSQGHRESFGASGPQRGNDHHAKIELDLVDAYEGAERTITLRSARINAEGHVVSDEHDLKVKIPKGVFEGQHIRLAGRGGEGRGGGAAGDLLLEVAFRVDARWRSQGRDVYQQVPVTPWEAMLGATISVSTLGGDTEVTVPAGWRRGRRLRLKGRGIPGSGQQTAGDLYLELDLALPPAETGDARAAYAALASAFPTFAPRRGTGG